MRGWRELDDVRSGEKGRQREGLRFREKSVNIQGIPGG